VLLTFKAHWTDCLRQYVTLKANLLRWKRSTNRWRYTSSFHAAVIGTPTIQKGGKRREINARLSFNTACELGFRGSFNEWERLMGAATKP
jgi:hypothetical protein